MMNFFAFALTTPLLFLASVGPTITEIEGSSFRVTILYDDHSLRGHAKAQIALVKAAKKHCRGKGKAISSGTLELNNAEPIKKKETLELSEVYSCVLKK